jgi:hypothetical protein
LTKKKIIIVIVAFWVIAAFLFFVWPGSRAFRDFLSTKGDLVQRIHSAKAALDTNEKVAVVQETHDYYSKQLWNDDFALIGVGQLLDWATYDSDVGVRAEVIDLFTDALMHRAITQSGNMSETEIAKKNAIYAKNTDLLAVALIENIRRSDFDLLKNCKDVPYSKLSANVGHVLTSLATYDPQFKIELNRFLGKSDDATISTIGMKIDEWTAFWQNAAQK